MGMPILAGRPFEEYDGRDGAPVIVANQHSADRFWPGESAVGKIMRTAAEEREVIGVVPTGKCFSLGEELQGFMYLAQSQVWSFPATCSLPIVDRRVSVNARGMAYPTVLDLVTCR